MITVGVVGPQPLAGVRVERVGGEHRRVVVVLGDAVDLTVGVGRQEVVVVLRQEVAGTVLGRRGEHLLVGAEPRRVGRHAHWCRPVRARVDGVDQLVHRGVGRRCVVAGVDVDLRHHDLRRCRSSRSRSRSSTSRWPRCRQPRSTWRSGTTSRPRTPGRSPPPTPPAPPRPPPERRCADGWYESSPPRQARSAVALPAAHVFPPNPHDSGPDDVVCAAAHRGERLGARGAMSGAGCRYVTGLRTVCYRSV